MFPKAALCTLRLPDFVVLSQSTSHAECDRDGWDRVSRLDSRSLEHPHGHAWRPTRDCSYPTLT